MEITVLIIYNFTNSYLSSPQMMISKGCNMQEFTKDTAITIDSVSSKDLDDAIQLVRHPNGYTLTTYIANVSKHIWIGSSQDIRAREFLFSIYKGNAGCVKSMLSRYLSEEKLSLLPNESRDVVIFEFELDNNLNQLKTSVRLDKFINKNRLSQPDISEIINDAAHPLHEHCSLLANVALRLLDKRRESGALAIYDISHGWKTDEEGRLALIPRDECNIGYIVVQEMMILTNVLMADFCIKNNIPILYRNHQASDSNITTQQFAAELNEAIQSENYEKLAEISERMKSQFSRATVAPQNTGHKGLNMPGYAYFTSPIRRYVDLVNHRNLIAFIKGKEPLHDIDDLQDIAEKYNAKETDVKDDRSEFFKTKAKMDSEKNIISENFTEMTDKELYQAMKIVAEKDLPISEKMKEEILFRAQNNTIEHKLFSFIIAKLGDFLDIEFKNKLICALIPTPSNATSIYNILIQKFEFPELELEEKSVGASNIPIFLCKARLADRNIESSLIGAKNKKMASQLAILDILQNIFGAHVEIPSFNQPEPVKKPTPEKIKSAVRTSNHKGDLQEWCQKNKVPAPEYETTKVGPDHSPLFQAVVTVRMLGKPISSKSENCSSKKDAEQMAAKEWIDSMERAR